MLNQEYPVARRRVLYAGRFNIGRMLNQAAAGEVPSNHLHAVPLLGRHGWSVSAVDLSPAELVSPLRFQRRVWRERGKFDVVLAHSYHDIRMLAALRAAGLLDAPLAAFVHSFRPRPWERIALRGCARLFSLSSAATAALREGGARHGQVVDFPYGADPEFYRELPWFGPGGIVVSVGVSGRDFGTLIRAASSIRAEVHIVGRVAPADAAAAPSNVTCHSQGSYDLPFAAMEDLFRSANCVVVSHFGTAHPYGLNAVVEGMAYGRPVVLTAGAGIDIDPAALGFGECVPPTDPSALANAVNGILADDSRARARGSRARQLIDTRYNSMLMAKLLHEALHGLVPEH